MNTAIIKGQEVLNLLVIKNGRVITDEGIVEGKNVVINGSKILGIVDELPDTAEVIDAAGNFVSPGFIEIHIHGAAGRDTMDGTCDSINTISKAIAKHGTTSFLPTTVAFDKDTTKNAVNTVRKSMAEGTDAAEVLGIHLEGPFLNPKKKGAHELRYLRNPDIGYFMEMVDNNLSGIKIMTMAPELDGAKDLIKFLVGHGVVVSAGHSDGTYDDIITGIGEGVSHSTHLYNAMRGFNHREPGVVGAIFDSRITTEFIADGIHLHFAAIRTALAVKGYQNCALITDAMRACTMEPGKYSLGNLEVYVKDGAARLKDGTLAGSTLTMDRAVHNILKNTNLNIVEAVSMASSIPARIIKVDDRKGKIKQGYDADIIIFDNDVNVKTTIVGGKIIKDRG